MRPGLKAGRSCRQASWDRATLRSGTSSARVALGCKGNPAVSSCWMRTSISFRVSSNLKGSCCVVAARAPLMKVGWSVTYAGALSYSLDRCVTCMSRPGWLRQFLAGWSYKHVWCPAITLTPCSGRTLSAALMLLTESPCSHCHMCSARPKHAMQWLQRLLLA